MMLRKIKSRGAKPTKRRGRKIKFPDLDQGLRNWVLDKRLAKIKITVKRFMNYAKSRANVLAENGIVFSWGWLQKFMQRHKFSLQRPSSKILKPIADIYDEVKKFLSKIQDLLGSGLYDPAYFTNLDETGICTESKRTKTLETKGTAHVTVKSTNKEKDYTTELVGGSMLGEKFRPMVILQGKRQNLDRIPDNLLIHWREDGAWINKEAMKKYIRLVLKDWSKKISSNKRGLLIIDNFEGHIDKEIEKLLREINTDVERLPVPYNPIPSTNGFFSEFSF